MDLETLWHSVSGDSANDDTEGMIIEFESVLVRVCHCAGSLRFLVVAVDLQWCWSLTYEGSLFLGGMWVKPNRGVLLYLF